VRFSSDLRAALVLTGEQVAAGVPQVRRVELAVQERRTLQTLHEELTESESLLRQAEKNWNDFQHQLLAKYVPGTGEGTGVALSGDLGYTVPPPWNHGIALTADFRFVVPRDF